MAAKAHDVTLVTCAALAKEPDVDDIALREILARRGLRVAIVPWDDASYDWGGTGMALLRSTWDYHLRREAFLAWADRTAAVTRLLNPPEVLRWNTYKGYLLELAAKGLPVTPTELVKRGSKIDLEAMLAARRWKKVVIKPAVSGGSYKTMLADVAADPAGARAHLAGILAEGDALVQPYNPVVEGYGERSMILFDGSLSHAVRKRPAFGKGGGVAAAFKAGEPLLDNADVDPAVPAEDEAETARLILEGAGFGDVLYARVDLIRETDGRPVLMELELVEPSLFLRHAGRAGEERLADAVIRRLPA